MFKEMIFRTSLAVQWVVLSASTVGDLGWIPGQGTELLWTVWRGQKINKGNSDLCPKSSITFHRLLSHSKKNFFSFSGERPKKPIPLQDQTVRDEKGRYKRFHGAFSGGFSAGYFNTVGSKEGRIFLITATIWLKQVIEI